jgi:hypothetical protein
MNISLKAATHNQNDFPMILNCKMNISLKFEKKEKRFGDTPCKITESSFIKQNFCT